MALAVEPAHLQGRLLGRHCSPEIEGRSRRSSVYLPNSHLTLTLTLTLSRVALALDAASARESLEIVRQRGGPQRPLPSLSSFLGFRGPHAQVQRDPEALP